MTWEQHIRAALESELLPVLRRVIREEIDKTIDEMHARLEAARVERDDADWLNSRLREGGVAKLASRPADDLSEPWRAPWPGTEKH